MSTPWRLDELLERVLPLLEQQVGAERVIDHLPAAALEGALALELPEQGIDEAALLDALSAVLRHSPKSAHPLYLDKLYAGTEPVGQVAELVSAVVNLNVHTYDTAPPLTLLERSVIAGLAAQLGYDPDTADGLLYPGGRAAWRRPMRRGPATCITTAAASTSGKRACNAAARQTPSSFG